MGSDTTLGFNDTSKAAVLERTKRPDVVLEPVLAGVQAGPGGSTLFVVHEIEDVSVRARLSETWERLTGTHSNGESIGDRISDGLKHLTSSNTGGLRVYDQTAFAAKYGDPGSMRTLEEYEGDAQFLRNMKPDEEISAKAHTMLLRVKDIYGEIASLPEPLAAPSTQFSAPLVK